MAIKLELNMTNKWLYSLMAFAIILVLGVGVFAYNVDMSVGDPSVFGHSAGEIEDYTDNWTFSQEKVGKTNLKSKEWTV